MDVFIVTSTISTVHRSYYNTEQRLDQTIYTAQSIDKHCPGAYKIIVEGSGNLTENQINVLRQWYNMVLVVNDSSATENWNVSLGEISMIQKALGYIKYMNKPINRIFKLSGRYTLSEDFALENYTSEKYCFYQDTHYHNEEGYDLKWGWVYKTSDLPRTNLNYYLTVLYMIPGKYIDNFLAILNTPLNTDVEHMLYDTIPRDQVYDLSINGFEGTLGSNGTYIRR